MGRARRPVVAALLATLVLAACSGAGDRGPAERSADQAPVRATTTTAPPRPTLEPLAAVSSALRAEGDQRMVAVAADDDGVGVAVGRDGAGPALWRAGSPESWQRVSLDPAAVPDDAHLSSVAVAPSGSFVVAGDVGGTAAVWTSPDGRTWGRAVVDPGPALTAVADTVVGMLAFSAGDGDVAVWRSFDGEVWVRTFEQEQVFGRPGAERIAGVADIGRGVVVVVDRVDGRPEVWASSDGFSWSVAPAAGAELLPADGDPSARAVAQLDDGTIVAVGSVAAADGLDAGAWTSTSGRTWEAAPLDQNVLGGDGGQAMHAVAVDPDGRLVAVGTEEPEDGGPPTAVVWTSVDGLSWRRADPAAATPAAQGVGGAAVVGGEVVAVGWQAGADGDDAAVWRVGAAAPTDPEPAPVADVGPVWSRVEADVLGGPGEQRLDDVATAPGGFVAVGSVRSPVSDTPADVPGRPAAPVEVGDADGAVWLSSDARAWERADDAAMGGAGDQRVAGVAAGPGGLVAVGTDGDDGAAWRSDDGRVWRRVADDGALAGDGRQAVRAVAPGGPGYVAVGVDAGDDEGDAAVWVSSDGSTWQRAAGSLAAPGAQELHGVTAAGDRVVVVGTDGGEAAVWSSTDLATWERTGLGGGRALGVDGLDGAVVVVGGAPGPDGGLDAAAWRLAGSGWQRADRVALDAPGGQEAAAVALGEELAVAVGRTDHGGGDDAASWASPDAARWAPGAHDENVLGGDQAQRMAGVVVAGPTAVAVGWTGSAPGARDAVVWVADQVDVAGPGRQL